MNIIVLFMVSVMAIFVWWMLLQRITAKPWLEQGVAFDPRVAGGNGYSPYVAGKLALWVFMVVISSLFMLFITAYRMRMELNDRSEEHTSELQSREDLVCRLLLEKKR